MRAARDKTATIVCVQGMLMLALLCMLSPHRATGQARIPLEDILPGDGAVTLIVADIPMMLETWKTHPFAKAWEDEKMQQFLAPVRQRMKIDQWDELLQEETGYTLDEILQFFPAQAAVSFSGHGMTMTVAHIVREDDFEAWLAQDLETTNEDAEEGDTYREIDEEFQGETLHLRQRLTEDEEIAQGGWAIVNGIVIMTASRALLQETVDRIHEGGNETSLSATDAFRRIEMRAPERIITGMANIGQLFATLTAGQNKTGAEPGDEPPGRTRITLDPASLFHKIGLHDLQTAFLAVTSDRGTTQMDMGLWIQNADLLSKLLAFRPGDPLRPAFIPPDAASFTTERFSLSACWNAVKDILAAMSPQFFSMFEAQLAAINDKANIDLEKNLIGNLGDDIIRFAMPRPSATPGEGPELNRMDQLFAFSILDRQGFESTLEGLLAWATQGHELFETRDFMGTTIHRLKILQPPTQNAQGEAHAAHISYALIDTFLFLSVGSDAPLESTLIALRKPRDSIWDKAGVQEALASLPADGACGIGYSDFSRVAGEVMEGIASIQRALILAGSGERFCNPVFTPDPESIANLFSNVVHGTYLMEGSILLRTKMTHPDASSDPP